jgi:NAD(P)-dependent dehydrogenase (short-subunit alcohol dehydrogenase family)
MTSPVAIITGAGSGIGRATAIELAKTHGHRVVLCGRRREPLEETAKLAGNGLAIEGDVSKPADVARLVEQALAQFGRIDVVVNNAGFAPVGTVEELSLDKWRAILDTNLSAAFYLIKAVWPVFKRQRGGVIVNISSLAARDPFAGLGAYGAAKAGLNLLSLALAREGAADNIRVYTVAPGAVETQMLRGIVSQDQLPPQQTLDPADIARVIAQCAAGDLRYSSGEVIWVHKMV